MTLFVPTESPSACPPRLHPAYLSIPKGAPSKPLSIVKHTPSEFAASVYGHESVQTCDEDRTREHKGAPLGERLIVYGRVLDEDGRAVPDTLVELCHVTAGGQRQKKASTFRHSIARGASNWPKARVVAMSLIN